MALSPTEMFIVESERRYKTTKDKVLYVNIKNGATDQFGNVIMSKYNRPVVQAIGKDKYYRMLGAIQRKYAQRTEDISIRELPNLIDTRHEYSFHQCLFEL